MGLLTMCIGVGPLGFLMLGWLAEALGASAAAVVSAVVGLVVLGVTWRWWRACWWEEKPREAGATDAAVAWFVSHACHTPYPASRRPMASSTSISRAAS
jgi:hypothetical protein